MGRRRHQRAPSRIVARYDYTDPRGRVLYQVCRYEPKWFSVHSAAGQTLLQGGRYPKVPYRLVELLAADPSETVFVVEGEKDVERLRSEGLTATCNAFGGGKGKWSRGHSRYLRGRHVVVLPDNDDTGREHARCVVKALHRVAASVRLVHLGLGKKADVSDWLDAGHTVDELRGLPGAARRWRPRDSPPEPRCSPDWPFDPDKWDRGSDHRDKYHDMRSSEKLRLAIYTLPVGPSEKLLLVMLAEFADCRQEQLAEYLGVTPRRVRQMLSSLISSGHLVASRRGRKNCYRVLEPGRS